MLTLLIEKRQDNVSSSLNNDTDVSVQDILVTGGVY